MEKNDQSAAGLGQDVVPEETERFLTFSLKDEQYAVPLLKVREVIELSKITPIPYVPVYFKGIMNLRGQVISVIDLRLKLNLLNPEIRAQSAIIILDLSPLHLGVIVDSINNVLAVEKSQIHAPPDLESQVKSDYIFGVTRTGDNLVILLDIERTLNAEDFGILNKQSLAKVA